MRPELRALGLLCVAGLIAGCDLLLTAPAGKTVETVTKPDPSLGDIADHLDMMSRLNQGSPAEQAEIFQRARDAAETVPTTSNLLRYALALATPGHGSSDPTLASQKLAELLATQESLMPAERALAWVVLKDTEQQLILQAENRSLQESSERLERERGSATSRRLQAEIEENARLKRALAEAQAKLDEITRIERSIIERKPSNGSR